jgi:hypothetical protein
MPPLYAPALFTGATSIASWIAENYDKIPIIAGKTSRLIEDLISAGTSVGPAISRLGSNIVWNSSDGQHVIGGIEEIQGSLSGLTEQSTEILTNIDGLRSLTMISVGFSGLSVGMLAAQFIYLEKRLKRIQKEIHKVQIKIDDTQEAQLKASLDYHKQAAGAVGSKKEDYYHEAVKRARDVSHFFSAQSTNATIHEGNPTLIHYYARKYFLALASELSGLLGREELNDVIARVSSEEDTMKFIASLVYESTIKDRIGELMTPELIGIAPLHVIERLYNQASQLGCLSLDEQFDIRSFIDMNRKTISGHGITRSLNFDYRQFKRSAAQKLGIAVGAFEEIQRLQSWKLTAMRCAASGSGASELEGAINSAKKDLAASDSSFMIYAY